jgi:hypothetical protein
VRCRRSHRTGIQACSAARTKIAARLLPSLSTLECESLTRRCISVGLEPSSARSRAQSLAVHLMIAQRPPHFVGRYFFSASSRRSDCYYRACPARKQSWRYRRTHPGSVTAISAWSRGADCLQGRGILRFRAKDSNRRTSVDVSGRSPALTRPADPCSIPLSVHLPGSFNAGIHLSQERHPPCPLGPQRSALRFNAAPAARPAFVSNRSSFLFCEGDVEGPWTMCGRLRLPLIAPGLVPPDFAPLCTTGANVLAESACEYG